MATTRITGLAMASRQIPQQALTLLTMGPDFEPGVTKVRSTDPKGSVTVGEELMDATQAAPLASKDEQECL